MLDMVGNGGKWLERLDGLNRLGMADNGGEWPPMGEICLKLLKMSEDG